MSTPTDEMLSAIRASRSTERPGWTWAPSKTQVDRAFRECRSSCEYTRDIEMPSNMDIYRALRAHRADDVSYHDKRDRARETEDWYSTANPHFTVSESFSERIGDCLCDMRMDAGKIERLEEEIRELKRKAPARYARFYLVVGERARLRLDVDRAAPDDPQGDDELRRRIDQLTHRLHGSTAPSLCREPDEPTGAPSE